MHLDITSLLGIEPGTCRLVQAISACLPSPHDDDVYLILLDPLSACETFLISCLHKARELGGLKTFTFTAILSVVV